MLESLLFFDKNNIQNEIMDKGIISNARKLIKSITLFVIGVGIAVLWFIDQATNTTFKFLTHMSKKFTVLAIASIGLLGLGYSIYSGYLTAIAENFFIPSTITTPSIISYPYKNGNQEFPQVTSKAVLAVDVGSGKILYEKNAREKLAPASTVKLLTALVALDLYKPYDEIKVPKVCTEVDSTKAGLPEKVEFRVRDLLNGMLIGSIGDAACALASGKVSSGEFVFKMNQKAFSLGMQSTHFSNPIGLDDEYGLNYSTAEDLYKLAIASINVSEIKVAVRSPDYLIRSINGKYSGNVYSTNRFLWEVPNTVGIKTGTTTDAGEVLIYEYNDGAKDIMIIVMGSTDRFTDTKATLDWVLANYKWKS